MQKIILSIVVSLMLFNPCIAADIEIPPAKILQSPVEKYPVLKNTVASYMKAWVKKDIKTMYGYESWEGGANMEQMQYAGTFNPDFNIHTWQITQVKPIEDENDRYKILVLISHNPPQKIAALIPKGQTVNSTLNQLWKKQGDKFVHLFNLERQNFLKSMPPQPAKPADKTPAK
ncbi:MAG: hypothetical protein IMF12_12040 [Proteobacteria bacterium]|nr:hypothetical protein [Pseudomonadota bacterium]